MQMQSGCSYVPWLETREEPERSARVQTAPRPSLSEINAIIRGLGIHALGREDYGVLLDGRMATGRARSAPRLTLRRRRRVIAAHRLPAWWAAVMTEPEYARDLLLTALFTGSGPSKILALRWDYVDLAGKTLYFPQIDSVHWLGLPMSDFLAELINERRRTVGWCDWVFPGRGRTGHIAEIKSIVKRVGERSAVPFTLSDLRRSFIAIAANLDVPVFIVKRLLGHRSGDATGRYGGDIVAELELLRDPVQRIADRILRLANAHGRRNAGPCGAGSNMLLDHSCERLNRVRPPVDARVAAESRVSVTADMGPQRQ
jgi:integrase